MCKATECATRRGNDTVDHGLWVTTLYQCRFIHCKKCGGVWIMGEACAWGQEDMGTLCTFLSVLLGT